MQEFWFPGSKTSKFLLHFFNFTIYSTLVYQCCEWCLQWWDWIHMPCLDYNLVQEPVTLSFIYVDVEALMDYSVSIGSGDVSSLVKTDLYCLFMMSALSFGLWCIFSFLWCYAVVGLSKCLSDIIPEYLVYVFQSDCLHSHSYLCVHPLPSFVYM